MHQGQRQYGIGRRPLHETLPFKVPKSQGRTRIGQIDDERQDRQALRADLRVKPVHTFGVSVDRNHPRALFGGHDAVRPRVAAEVEHRLRQVFLQETSHEGVLLRASLV